MIYILPFHQWIYFKKEIETIKDINITYKNFPLKSFNFFHGNIQIACYFYGYSQEILPEKFFLIFKYLTLTKKPTVICTHIIDILTIISCSEAKHKKLVLFIQDSEFLKPGKLEQLISYYYPSFSGNSYLLTVKKELFLSKLKKAHLLCISKALARRVKEFSEHKPFVMKYYLNKAKIVSTNFNREYIGFVNPTLEKGLGILIQIALAMPDRKFLITGDAGPATDFLKEIFSIIGNIIWQPFDSEIKHFWDKIRIFITPSFWGEGFHRVVLEAMINGIPVLATNQEVIKEVLNNTGFTFDTGYHLEQTPAKSIKSKNININPWITKIE
jgi:glycosyltransferase involved in cell wall biosynthesis